jgi:hypothetical protein
MMVAGIERVCTGAVGAAAGPGQERPDLRPRGGAQLAWLTVLML